MQMPSRSTHLRYVEIDDAIELHDAEAFTVHRLSPMLSQVWLASDGITPLADIAQSLALEPEAVSSGISELADIGAVHPRGDAKRLAGRNVVTTVTPPALPEPRRQRRWRTPVTAR